MTTYNEAFEFASSGSITTSNSTLDSVAGTVTYTTAPTGRTGNCASMSGTSCLLGYTTDLSAPVTSGMLYSRVYMRFAAVDTTYSRVHEAVDQQGSYLGNGWRTSYNADLLRLYSLTTNSGDDYQYSVDTWYRLEIDVDYTNKTVVGRIYLGDSATPETTQNTSWTTIARTNVNGQCDRLFVQRNLAGVTYVDDFAWSKDAQPGSSYVPPSIQPGQLNARIAVGA